MAGRRRPERLRDRGVTEDDLVPSSCPESLCAEASAIAAMVSAGERSIDTIVVVGDGEVLSTPCGGCRQKIREFSDEATMVHVAGPDGVRSSYSVAELLPDSFGPEHLGR